jgi:hypothetical protein
MHLEPLSPSKTVWRSKKCRLKKSLKTSNPASLENLPGAAKKSKKKVVEKFMDLVCRR